MALWRIRGPLARPRQAGTLLVTAGWAWVLLGRSPDWMPWLRVVIALAGAAAAGLEFLASPGRRPPFGTRTRGAAVLAIAPISLALVAGLAGPLAYSIDTAATAHGGSIPTAGLTVTSASGAPGGFPERIGLRWRIRFPGRIRPSRRRVRNWCPCTQCAGGWRAWN